ncbi:arginase [Clostridium sp. LBM24168]
MSKILLSIDWDYFIPISEKWSGSYIENKRNIMLIWYKRYFENKRNGNDIERSIRIGNELYSFIGNMRKYFKFSKSARMYVSDSHKFSYDIALKNKCESVINIDAHSDLGYGGIKSLEFEVNCANWLGKLLKNNIIKNANVVYSPYTREYKEEFSEINNNFNIDYPKLEYILEYVSNIKIDTIHVCRSGSWTPPWLDDFFNKFIHLFNIPYKIIDCSLRSWHPEKLTLADRIYMCI